MMATVHTKLKYATVLVFVTVMVFFSYRFFRVAEGVPVKLHISPGKQESSSPRLVSSSNTKKEFHRKPIGARDNSVDIITDKDMPGSGKEVLYKDWLPSNREASVAVKKGTGYDDYGGIPFREKTGAEAREASNVVNGEADDRNSLQVKKTRFSPLASDTRNTADAGNGTLQGVGTECKKLPDVLIIGFEKCGTMTLKRFLGVNPQVLATPEVNDGFFGSKTKTLQDYNKRTPCTPSGQLKVEKMDLRGIPSKVYKYRKDMKLLAIVRDPIVRSISHYLHRVVAKHENLSSFDDITERFLNNSTVPYRSIITFSLYYKKLEPWLQYFPRTQLHVVDGDNFVVNPASELQKVEVFLGVTPSITLDSFVYSKEKKFFCLRGNGEAACMNRDKGRPHPTVAPKTVQNLRKFFEPHNRKFFKLFGEFPWSGPVP